MEDPLAWGGSAGCRLRQSNAETDTKCDGNDDEDLT